MVHSVLFLEVGVNVVDAEVHLKFELQLSHCFFVLIHILLVTLKNSSLFPLSYMFITVFLSSSFRG